MLGLNLSQSRDMKGAPAMEYQNIDDDLYPTTFFHRVSTWVIIAVSLGLLGFVGMRARAIYSVRKIDSLIERRQYDSAWTILRSAKFIGDCRRYALMSDLLMRDERDDSLLLKIADSCKRCNPKPATVYGLVARGNLRLANRGTTLDSAVRYKLFQNAYNAALKCVHADSLDRDCGLDGFLAQGGMNSPAGQLEWVAGALTVFPEDSLFLALKAQAVAADSVRRASSATVAGAKPDSTVSAVAAKGR